MEPHRMMDELLGVARKLGLKVRIEPFETPGVLAGGLCWLRGRQLILIDESAPLVERVGAMAEALGTFAVEGIYMPPEVRRAIESARRRTQHRPSSPAATDDDAGEDRDDQQ